MKGKERNNHQWRRELAGGLKTVATGVTYYRCDLFHSIPFIPQERPFFQHTTTSTSTVLCVCGGGGLCFPNDTAKPSARTDRYKIPNRGTIDRSFWPDWIGLD
mmetsp:Transcript_21573/g.47101  ORF Transcript_21573/g.47101 Transcript_21573/m.47101 type:complete len:103 (-) Transcript_21573:569-877(-)